MTTEQEDGVSFSERVLEQTAYSLVDMLFDVYRDPITLQEGSRFHPHVIQENPVLTTGLRIDVRSREVREAFTATNYKGGAVSSWKRSLRIWVFDSPLDLSGRHAQLKMIEKAQEMVVLTRVLRPFATFH